MNMTDTLKDSYFAEVFPKGWDIEKIADCVSQPPESVTQPQPFWNPAFRPVACENLEEFGAYMGHEIAMQIRRTKEEGRKLILILPVGPMGMYKWAVYFLKEWNVDCKHVYRAGDKTALRAMLTELDETLVRLERFHDAYQAQWMQENKPHGFDVQDIRLGGLMQRVKTCRARLEDYCGGRLDRLEELEAAQLDFFDHGKRCAEPVATHWGQIATANIVYMTMLW